MSDDKTFCKSLTVRYIHIADFLKSKVIVQSVTDETRFVKCEALWDTGADYSAIRKEVAKELGLKSVGKVLVASPDKKRTPNRKMYCINLNLSSGIEFSNVNVVEPKNSRWDIIIGMDIISRGDFAVTHYNGKTVFSFRIPSMCTINFKRSPCIEGE